MCVCEDFANFLNDSSVVHMQTSYKCQVVLADSFSLSHTHTHTHIR